MALSITVNGAGTFTASMEEGPVSFSASLAAVGPAGPGVAAGGTTGQILVKTTNADYATGWIDNAARSVFISGRNNTGSTIAKGAVVYLSGATGNKATIALAQANSEATSARTIGITKAEVANGADVDVVISGAIENIDTSAFSAGQVVYLSASTAGGLTTTLPTQPNHGVVVGIVTRSNANQGSIEVTVQNYQELKELSDVLVSNPQNGQALIYETSSGLWKNLAIPAPDLSAYLTSATAAATYQTIAGMSSYLTTSAAASTYAPIASPTFTGTVTIPAGASIDGYLTTSSASSTYLAKASNLSDLANAATARSNLGLGTMATETASDYLTKAGNLSGLASNATARTNLDVYSKSESDALVPSASTTVAGKVELADDSEARAATATNRAVTPSSFPWMAVRPGFRSLAAVNSTSVSGSGSANASSGLSYSREAILTSLATGRAAFRFGISALVASGIMPSRGYLNRIDFSKKIWLAGTTCMNLGTVSATDYSGDANTISRVCFGRPGEASTADMTGKGIGIKKVGGASSYVTLTVHDGTNLTDVATTYQNAAQENFEWVLYSDGSGNVTLWINGSQAATTSAGPTGLGDANYGAYIEQVYAASTPTVRQGMQSTGGWIYIES